MTVAEPSTNLQLIALDQVYGGPRRSRLGSKPNRIVLAIIGCHLLLTSFLAAHLNLWIDEAYSLATTNNSLPTTLQWAIGFEEQAPLYFILLWFTRHLHDSIFITRLPSILATAGSLWLTSRISAKLFPMVHRGWLVLALAFNPFIVAIALEARGYAWAVFLSTALLWLFLKGYANTLLDPTPSSLVARPLIPPQNQPWASWAYGATAVIALYSHYFLAFQIAAQGIVLLLIAMGSVERRKRAIASFSQYCLDSLIIMAFTLPLFLLIGPQLNALQDNSPIVESPGAVADLTAALKAAISKTLFRNLVYLVPSDPAGTPGWNWRLGRLMVGIWLIALAWGRRRQLRFNVTLAWLIHGLVLVQLFGAFALVPSVEYRHAIVMVGLVYFSALGLISLLPRTRRRLLLSLSLMLLLCLNARSLWQVYAPLAKPGDYARVGEYLQQVVTAQEPVVVFNSEVAMALSHYYPGQNPSQAPSPVASDPNGIPARIDRSAKPVSPQPQALIALPRSLFNHPDETIPQYRKNNLILTSSQQIEAALAHGLDPETTALGAAPPNLPPSLWLVRDDQILTAMASFDESYRILDDFMAQNYRLLTLRQFHGTQVQQWQRLPQNSHPLPNLDNSGAGND